jgi:hypothetical protein
VNLDFLLSQLRTHLAALRSSAWSRGGEASGPILYLDIADTEAMIAEFTRLKAQRAASAPSDTADFLCL